MKDTQKTPKKEIQKAKMYFNEYIERIKENGEVGRI